MAAQGCQRAEISRREIDEIPLIVAGIDVKVESRLRLKARGHDLAPDPDDEALRKAAAVACQQAAKDLRFAARAHGWRNWGGGIRPLHAGDRLRHLGPKHQKVVHRIVDLIDLGPQFVERLVLQHRVAANPTSPMRLCAGAPVPGL